MATFDVNSNTRKVQATANGSNTDFPFSFQVNATADIKVFVDNVQKTESVHYTIKNSTNGAGLNADGTGKVVFDTNHIPTNNQTVAVKSDVPKSRTSVYTSGGNITAASLEGDFDTITMQLGDNKEELNRSIKAPVGDPDNIDMTLPTQASRLGTVLGFNATTGNPEAGPKIADVSTLSAITADIATLADIEDGTVATNAIQNVGNIATQVEAVGNNATNIATVASNVASVNTVATNINDVVTVANDLNEAISEIETAASDLQETTSEIDTVANNIANVNTVGTDIANVNTVAGDTAAINTVATNLSGSNTIGTVAGLNSQVTALGAISADITTAATNVTDITNFADVYLGGYSSAPTTRNDGTALQIGDLYFHTQSGQQNLKVRASSGWITAASAINGTANRFQYAVSASTSSVTGADANGNVLAYDAGFVDVYLNGVKMVNGHDVTVTSGNTVTFASPIGVSGTDRVDIIAFGTFTLANFSINDANDVQTTGVTAGDALIFDGSSNKFQPGKASSAEVYGFIKSYTGTTVNYTITVQSVGGQNKYFVNGVQQQTLELLEGNTYVFSYPSAHPFALSTTSDGSHGGGSEYTTGVTRDTSAYTLTYVVPSAAPQLYYYCTSHSGMGGTANTPVPANNTLQVITTNQGADNITNTQYNSFDDVLFSSSGFTFSIDGTTGNLIATV